MKEKKRSRSEERGNDGSHLNIVMHINACEWIKVSDGKPSVNQCLPIYKL